MIIYLHGFNSSPLSGKCRDFAAYCGARGLDLIAPQLPHRPAQAAAMLEKIAAPGDLLVGSSLGGFYATWFCETHPQTRGHPLTRAHPQTRAVLINPAVRAAAKLAPLAGQVQRNFHNGSSYRFTERHAAELRALTTPPPKRPADYLLLLQTGDELLDWREAAAFYHGAQMVVEAGGDHGFVNFARHFKRILQFAGMRSTRKHAALPRR